MISTRFPVVSAHHAFSRREILLRSGSALAGVALVACTAPAAPTAAPTAKPAAGATTAPATGQPAAKLGSPVKLGLHIPITGPLAALGTLTKRGAQLAIEEINAKGGIGGQQIQVIDEDAGATNDNVIASYKRLAAQAPHVVIGTVATTQVLAASPDIKEAKAPYFFFSTGTAATRQGIPNLFRLNYQDEMRLAVTVPYLINTLKKDKVASFHTNEDYGNGAHQVVVELLKKLNVPLVTEQVAGVNDKDLTAQVTTMVREGVNGVVANSFPTTTALLIKTTKQLGASYTLMGDAGPPSPSVLNILTDQEADGVYSASAGVPQAVKEDRVQNWIKSYQDKWKEDPDAYSANGYDAVHIAKQAIDKIGALDGQQITQAIAATKAYPGINYPITFDRFGDGVHAVVLVRLKNKTPEIIELLWEEGYKP